MSTPGIERRIFLVGVPRSGTTLLQSLLAAHGGATSFTESHFFSRHFTLPKRFLPPVLVRDPAPRLQEFLAENGEPPPDAAHWFEATRGMLRPLHGREATCRFLSLLDTLARRREKTLWIEKTPRHLRYIPWIEKLSADTPVSFVHVLRDGLESVASLYAASQHWPHPYDLAACVRRWNVDVAYSLARRGSPTDHLVTYEELTAEPERVLRRLLGELGLDWDPQILASYGEASARLVTPDEAWKQGVGREIRASATSERVLDAEQREWVRCRLRRG